MDNNKNKGRTSAPLPISEDPKLQAEIERLRPHLENVTSTRDWDEYRKQHDLPHSQTLINKFGSWNRLKEALSMKQNALHRPVKYTPDVVREILQEHGTALTGQVAWNNYAKENQLPNYKIIFERLSETEVYEITGYIKKYTVDISKKIVLEHFPDKPPTFAEWERLAKVNRNVPSATGLFKQFGSWRNMVSQIYQM